MKAGEHGPDKLYDKFVVVKTKDVISNEFVFVLRPETDDQAAIAALHTYADACEATYPQLAVDIRAELARIRGVR